LPSIIVASHTEFLTVPTLIELATAQEAEIVALYKLTLNHHWTRGSSGLALQV